MNHITTLFSISWEICILLSIVAVTIYNPINKWTRVSFSPRISQHLLPLILLVMAILTGVRWQIIVVSICISLITDDIENLFMYLLAIYNLCKNVCSGPLPILKWIFKLDYLFFLLFFCYWFVCVLYVFCILTLYIACKYFFPFWRLSFHFVDDYSCYIEAFKYEIVSKSCFFKPSNVPSNKYLSNECTDKELRGQLNY